jgi:heme/copper-type cytochrome/quinol oxidase subunit 2
MRSEVHVVSRARFQAWLKSQESGGAPVATSSTAQPGHAGPAGISAGAVADNVRAGDDLRGEHLMAKGTI